MIFEDSDNDSDDATTDEVTGLTITKETADHNYALAGTLVKEQPDELSLEKYQHLLSDKVHNMIMEVIEETKLSFELADFQKLSLHVLGSKRNLILVSPTGSGKMLGMFQISYFS